MHNVSGSDGDIKNSSVKPIKITRTYWCTDCNSVTQTERRFGDSKVTPL